MSGQSRMTELTFLRYLPRQSPVHGMWAGTKVVCLTVIGVAFAIRPSWISVAIGAGIVAIGFVAARLPLGVFPRLPLWFLGAVAITAFFSFVAGGDPSITVGDVTIGFDGILTWLRLTLLTVISLVGAGLFGWTTELGELGPALARLLRPLRIVRFPVDEFAVVVAVAARTFPLLIDEFRTLIAAWRIRAPEVPVSLRGRVVFVHDILVTAMVSAVRRAREMALAIEARGTQAAPAAPARSLGLADVVALVLTIGGGAAMILL